MDFQGNRSQRELQMIYFVDELPKEHEVKCDICVIGSGFAGVSLAQRLSRQKNLKVVVAEGSSSWYGTISARHPPPNPPEQKLYNGKMSGWISKTDPNYLLNSRLRGIGGTSSLWSGWGLSLDPSDLTRHKKALWPMPYKDLAVYYQEAKRFLHLNEKDFDCPQEWFSDCSHEKLDLLPTEGSAFYTRVLQLNPLRIQNHYTNLFLNKMDLYRNAHLVELPQKNGKILSALFQTMDLKKHSHSFKIQADFFVLALGSLETTRQLLLSGVKSEWLGKSFMEHPYIWNGASFDHAAMPPSTKRFYDASRPIASREGTGFVGMLAPHDNWLRQQTICSFRSLLYLPESKKGWLNLSFEQAPHERSSICLSEEKDIFGNPILSLDSHWSKLDDRTAQKAIETTCSFLKEIKCISRVQIPEVSVVPGFHPAGTTRMALDPSKGVVNSNCQVFERPNLYVASASIFPSCGYANPTLTIIAMAQRLADYLIQVKNGSRSKK